MRLTRTHSAGVLLAAVAVLGVLITHTQRQTAVRDYADAANYNRAITSFLHGHRGALVGRHVAVFGLSGMSPFSLTSGRYLTRLLGAPSSWHVYVPRSDPFYPLRVLPGGTITVRPESFACELSAFAIFVVFDGDGRGRFAADCNAALEAAHPVPDVEGWQPRSVTLQEASAGFVIAISGSRLGGAVALTVDGRPVATVKARRGQLMTASIPPQPTPGKVIAFTVEHRGRPAFQGRIDVLPQGAASAGGDAGTSGAAERPSVRP
jgi:hypothetical protein